ncbi:hypothetical protein AYI69_g6257 [Smittium culicis]|uniref:Uncharacterized protein n=1 Tax=Smittium culicis TaxID=133412 RepID=A0A1R1Y085_9FUNG|nr:hypothetical protein AYI69_g6257 [Smittium culicis]
MKLLAISTLVSVAIAQASVDSRILAIQSSEYERYQEIMNYIIGNFQSLDPETYDMITSILGNTVFPTAYDPEFISSYYNALPTDFIIYVDEAKPTDLASTPITASATDSATVWPQQTPSSSSSSSSSSLYSSSTSATDTLSAKTSPTSSSSSSSSSPSVSSASSLAKLSIAGISFVGLLTALI